MQIRVRVCLIMSLTAMLATGCGSSFKPNAPSTTPATTLSMPVETVFIRAYFLRGGRLAATGRKTVRTLGVGNASIGALLAGPIAVEHRIGFKTALPAEIQQRRVVLDKKTLTVELTKNLNRTARAQVVTTLTQFPTVHSVVLVTPAGSSRPLTRADFENLLPAVLIESPVPFGQVKSPLRVRGSSNTFEATSQLELLDENGKLLAAKTITASSGTGTRGTFDVTLSFKAPAGPATLVSYENSAKDGSRIDVVRIPVRISG
ncbi:MAG: Gmad2 immunoglobulin-like domain-containing protein [Gaiellaceae bacterium]